jgi:UDP-2,3-diacylglucosamine pyrophosphatase LpxH
MATKLQNVWRSKLARRRTEGIRRELHDEREAAATRVASNYRGFRERSRVLKSQALLEDELVEYRVLLEETRTELSDIQRLASDLSTHNLQLETEVRNVTLLLSEAKESFNAEVLANELLSDELSSLRKALSDSHEDHSVRLVAHGDELRALEAELTASRVEVAARMMAHDLIERELEEARQRASEEAAAKAELVLLHMSADAKVQALERDVSTLQEELSATSSELTAIMITHDLAKQKLEEEAARKEEEVKAAQELLVVNQMSAALAAHKLEEELNRLRGELSASVEREQVCVESR